MEGSRLRLPSHVVRVSKKAIPYLFGRYVLPAWPFLAAGAGYAVKGYSDALPLLGAVYATFLSLSALFSGTETAVVSAQPHAVRDGRVRPYISSVEEKGRLLQAILLGNNLVNIGIGSIGAAVAYALHNPALATAADFISLAFIYLFGEVLPKKKALQNPEGWLQSLPVRSILPALSKLGRALDLFTPKGEREEGYNALIEVVKALEAQYGESLSSMIYSYAHFLTKPVGNLSYKPAHQVAMVDKDMTLGEAYRFIKERMGRTYSRVVVVDSLERACDDLRKEDVVGILHLREIWERAKAEGDRVVLDGKVENYVTEKITFLSKEESLLDYLKPETQRYIYPSLGKVVGVVDNGRVVGFLFLSALGDLLVAASEREDEAHTRLRESYKRALEEYRRYTSPSDDRSGERSSQSLS